jgi:glycosyltransferase involved in cell wall biosynthesis
MKILLVHHEIPYPIRSGWDKMTYNLIRMLRMSHEVSLIAPVFKNTDPEDVEHLASICDHLIAVPVNSESENGFASPRGFLQRNWHVILSKVPGKVTLSWYPEFAKGFEECCLIHHYDVVQAASIFTYRYLRYSRVTSCRVLGPMDDGIESSRSDMHFEKHCRKKAAAALEWRAMRSYETKAYLNSDWALFYSDQDLKRVLDRTPGITHARHCPVATEHDVPSHAEVQESFSEQDSNSILFVGGLSPFFNQDAVMHFCAVIFPRVLAQIPSAQFIVVGHNPPPDIQHLAQNSQVIVTGGVKKEELISLIKRASVYVGPIRSGTGVKTKIIEAMSFGKAIVATSTAVMGLFDLPENAIRIQNEPENFAQAIVDLLRKPEERVALGIRARVAFESKYSFEAILPKLTAVYDEIGHTLVHSLKVSN